MLRFQFSCSDPEPWVEHQLRGARLSDSRRRERAVKIAKSFARHPGKTIPQRCERKYEMDATYDFFKRPEATPDNIQAGHREAIRGETAQPGRTILLLEDTTEMTWPGNEPIEGLGPIGSGAKGLQGFLLHSVLAVRWPKPDGAEPEGKRPPVDVLGLADQQYHVRQRHCGPKRRREAPAGTKRMFESQLWERAGKRLGPAPEGVRWVRVCDRGADLYEFLTGCRALNHGFVVRAAKDRCLEEPVSGTPAGNLFPTVRQSQPLGRFTISLRTRPKQKARTVQLSVSVTSVVLRSTQRPGHPPGSLPGIPCTVVRVFEAAPPRQVKEPLEWILLTDQPVAGFDEAVDVALQYATRWLIEEFHKALKTGLGAEKLQLEAAGRLFAAIAIMSLVALRLIDFRERVRVMPDEPAEQSGLSPLELQVLRVRLGRSIQTVRNVALAVGRLGGHLNRKSDGMPGWITLWRGFRDLELLVQGVRLSKKLRRFQE